MKFKKYKFILLSVLISSTCFSQTSFLSSKSIADSLSEPVKEQNGALTRGAFKPRANPDATTKVCDSRLNAALLEKTGTKGEQLTRTLYVEAVPNIDLDITFKKGEATLLPEGERQLDSLALALKDPRLAGQSFVVVGHTDADGGAEYNDRLSCERALSTKRYLQEKKGIGDGLLIPMGFGFSKLKDTTDKFNSVNRRVEIRKYVANLNN